ncbi:MAG: YihY/virulence factor BrkB family protein [Candidatus Sulfotelmatobacter sp.]
MKNIRQRLRRARKQSRVESMMFANTKRALASSYHDVLKNQTFQAAAALSYYSILCIFPALILLSAVMAHIPLPNFFQDSLIAMGRVLPPGTMPMVDSVLKDILGANSGAWLSLGTLGTLWLVSSTFDEMIEALDIAYDVDDNRPFWKMRLWALGLAAVTAVFLICAIATIIVGPWVGDWLAGRLSLTGAFVLFWPYIHWTIAIIFTVLAVATIYFLAPNLKQRFLGTLPGAVLSVACWIGLSFLLRIYFRYFGNYNRTYGTLAGVMALLTWLYWAYFILLAGGELNAELAKAGSAARPARE